MSTPQALAAQIEALTQQLDALLEQQANAGDPTTGGTNTQAPPDQGSTNTYQIAPCDTIYSIAQDAYGAQDSATLDKIRKAPANAGIVIDWDTLPTGTTISIPA